MRPRLASVALVSLLALAGCGKDVFGSPRRVKTHGYRARATVVDARGERKFELAVRDLNRRQAPLPNEKGPVVIWRGAEKKSFSLDPVARTYSERSFTAVDEVLPGHPLAPGFDHNMEARRRNVTQYTRESDDVLAGHACWIWRFDDEPGKEGTPSTAYWVAPDLDFVVVRLVRDLPQPEGTSRREITDLTDVRVGADEDLFEIPKGYRQVPATKAPARP